MDDNVSVALVDALARIWSRIRLYHPAVPAVVVLAAPSTTRTMNVLGHFAALRWVGSRVGEGAVSKRMHEVAVVAENLNRRADQILETLLHEAAHAMNFERQIFDCSSTSQYHNAAFKTAALELGLDVERIPHYGYAYTKLPPALSDRYEREVKLLDSVLIHREAMTTRTGGDGETPDGASTGDGDDKPSSRSRKATCKCPFIIRVSKQTLERTVIRCESCGQPFALA